MALQNTDAPMSLFRTLTGYYKTRIGASGRHFDWVETTVSHLFRHRHPALDRRRYRGAIHAALAREGSLQDGVRFLEM